MPENDSHSTSCTVTFTICASYTPTPDSSMDILTPDVLQSNVEEDYDMIVEELDSYNCLDIDHEVVDDDILTMPRVHSITVHDETDNDDNCDDHTNSQQEDAADVKMCHEIDAYRSSINALLEEKHYVDNHRFYKINMYNFKHVWKVFLGPNRTVSWSFYLYMYYTCANLYDMYRQAIACAEDFYLGRLDNKTEQVSAALENMRDCYNDVYYNVSNLKAALKECTKLESKVSSTLLPCFEKNDTGLMWLFDLVRIYAVLQGPLPCTCVLMMQHFKEFHQRLDDDDFHQLIYRIESVLGNSNFDLIVDNFQRWINNNFSCLPVELRVVFQTPTQPTSMSL